jgi:hypothetical protein
MSCIDFDLDTLHRIKVTILCCISKDTKKINTDVRGEPLLYYWPVFEGFFGGRVEALWYSTQLNYHEGGK